MIFIGTTVSLQLKPEAKDFLEHETVRNLVKKYSQFINFPIYLWTSHTEQVEEPLDEDEKTDEEKTEDATEDDAAVEEEKEEEKPKTKKVSVTCIEMITLRYLNFSCIRLTRQFGIGKY